MTDSAIKEGTDAADHSMPQAPDQEDISFQALSALLAGKLCSKNAYSDNQLEGKGRAEAKMRTLASRSGDLKREIEELKNGRNPSDSAFGSIGEKKPQGQGFESWKEESQAFNSKARFGFYSSSY